MVKFRTNIIALDPYAKFFVDGDTLKVTHSRCNGKFILTAANDLSNFREHVSICQSTRPHIVALGQPTQVQCPGFSFKGLCGKAYQSLLLYERQQVMSATEAAGLAWLDSREKEFIISKSCLRKFSSHKEPAQPCENCLKAVELSKTKGTFSLTPFKSRNEFFNPYLSVDAAKAGTLEDKQGANVG